MAVEFYVAYFARPTQDDAYMESKKSKEEEPFSGTQKSIARLEDADIGALEELRGHSGIGGVVHHLQYGSLGGEPGTVSSDYGSSANFDQEHTWERSLERCRSCRWAC